MASSASGQRTENSRQPYRGASSRKLDLVVCDPSRCSVIGGRSSRASSTVVASWTSHECRQSDRGGGPRTEERFLRAWDRVGRRNVGPVSGRWKARLDVEIGANAHEEQAVPKLRDAIAHRIQNGEAGAVTALY